MSALTRSCATEWVAPGEGATLADVFSMLLRHGDARKVGTWLTQHSNMYATLAERRTSLQLNATRPCDFLDLRRLEAILEGVTKDDGWVFGSAAQEVSRG